jgi:hypothetical protein
VVRSGTFSFFWRRDKRGALLGKAVLCCCGFGGPSISSGTTALWFRLYFVFALAEGKNEMQHK